MGVVYKTEDTRLHGQLRAKMIAASMFEVHYTGKESHASAFPELGVNAADALTLAQTALGLLRQHIRSTNRIHGIVTNGGAAPNTVPAHTSAKYVWCLDQLSHFRGPHQIHTA